jgi:transposase
MVRTAKPHAPATFYQLQSVPGIGKLLSLVRLYEIHDIRRFPSVQDVVSYGRLVTCAQASAGKQDGASGTTIGNASLTWAFSDAAVLFLRDNPAGQTYRTRRAKTHGTGKALTVLAQK